MHTVGTQPDQSGLDKGGPDFGQGNQNGGLTPPEQENAVYTKAPSEQISNAQTAAGQSGNWHNSIGDGRVGPSPSNVNSYLSGARPGAYSISKPIKSGDRIVGYELSSGQKISCEQGVEMAKNGQISGVTIARHQGNEYLRAVADSEGRSRFGSLTQ